MWGVGCECGGVGWGCRGVGTYPQLCVCLCVCGGGGGVSVSISVRTESMNQKENVSNINWPTTLILAGGHAAPHLFFIAAYAPGPLFVHQYKY